MTRCYASTTSRERLINIVSYLGWFLARGELVLLNLVLPKEYATWADAFLYADWAIPADASDEPVRDLVEYPPLARAMLDSLGWVGDQRTYVLLFVVAMATTDLLIFRIIVGDSRPGARLGVVAWIVCPSLLGFVVWTRFDLVPALFAVLALRRGARPGIRGAAVGIGVAFKLWPIVLLPGLLWSATSRVKIMAATGLAMSVGLLVPTALGHAGVFAPLVWASERGLQIESVPATLITVQTLVGRDPALDYRFGAVEYTGAVADILASSSMPLLLASVILGALLLRRKRRSASAQVDSQALTLALVCLLMVSSKVLSPQYIIWLIAVFCSVMDHGRPARARWRFGLLLAICALTHLIYPYTYVALLNANSGAAAILVTRNLLLLAVLIHVWAQVRAAESASRPRTHGQLPDQRRSSNCRGEDEVRQNEIDGVLSGRTVGQ